MRVNDTFEYLSIGLPEDIQRRKIYGDFEGAIRLIELRLADNGTSEPLRRCLTVQKEIIKRLPDNYPYTKGEALDIIRTKVPDFTMDELDNLIDTGQVSWIYVQGEMHIFSGFFSTLCKTNHDFARRSGISLSGSESDLTEPEHSSVMRSRLKEEGRFSNRIRMKAWIKLKDELFTPGMKVKVHLPIPADCDEQSDIVIESFFPEGASIAPSDAPQRTVCWQEIMEENHIFSVEYSYTYTALFHDTQAAEAGTEAGQSAAPCTEAGCPQPDFNKPDFDTLNSYTDEKQPHIVFTPYIRALAESLTEGVTNPMEKARIFYDFITLNMRYTFMPEYFVLESIAETCARNYTGDCGVFALLFITLCRCSGIPARWQSGLVAEPDFVGAHDWARFYVAPYGWFFADPSYGISAARAGNEERRKFYFGNIDSFRMIANNEFQAPFTIDKDFWRADPYDNQYGEFESSERGFESCDLEYDCEMIKYEVI